MKDKLGVKLLPLLLRRLAFPVLILIALSTFYAVYLVRFKITLTEELDRYVAKGGLILLILAVNYLALRTCDVLIHWYGVNIAAKTNTRLDDEFIPLFKRASKVLIWVITLLIILSALGININALIAALGVSSLAIALAAQDTISNIIAGFLIMVDRPFRIGDKIKLPTGENVEVLEIGIRRSKFLNEDGAIIIMPNLNLSKSKIANITYGEEKKKEL